MEIGDAVKENMNTSLECHTNSANPASSADIELFIDATKQSYIISLITTRPSSDYGMIKTFVFTFSTDRNQNGKIARCHLFWDGSYINETKGDYLNITCK